MAKVSIFWPMAKGCICGSIGWDDGNFIELCMVTMLMFQIFQKKMMFFFHDFLIHEHAIDRRHQGYQKFNHESCMSFLYPECGDIV